MSRGLLSSDESPRDIRRSHCHLQSMPPEIGIEYSAALCLLVPGLNFHRRAGRRILWAILGCFAAALQLGRAQSSSASSNVVTIVEVQNIVEVSPAGAKTWVRTTTNQLVYPFDRVRTGPNSRVALRWSDASVVPFGASTELEILPPHEADAQCGLHLIRGVLSFFHRDKPGRIRIITRGAVAGVEGTEFVAAVGITNSLETTTLSVIDGRSEERR